MAHAGVVRKVHPMFGKRIMLSTGSDVVWAAREQATELSEATVMARPF